MTWTVDYGAGPVACTLPHAWDGDVDVRWEGPAVYRTSLRDLPAARWLVFHGASYRAEVVVNGAHALTHDGIWDAFAVRLPEGEADVEVRVTKNGGPAFPVKDVLSGFLPYVFHTFGGLYRGVSLVTAATDPTADPPPAPPSRVAVDGVRLLVDGRPFTVRGALTWGWYPELGHPCPSVEAIRAEVRQMRAFGFNTVKFCLWVPPHAYFDVLREEGMFAWLELPLWAPTGDAARLAQMEAEIGRIVREYRRHDTIIAWTVGCELSESTPPDFRARLVGTVRRETGCPLVKDNSGGAEMYGGDRREYGTFYDFHPYADAPFFPPLTASLLPGPRPTMPTLLGETNDFDVHRDLDSMFAETPYWARLDPARNDQGVRWQYDVPSFPDRTPLARPGSAERNARLVRSSAAKADFVRRRVVEDFRSHAEIAGYVLTGWRHTPISTAGFVDDAGEPVFDPAEVRVWNGPDALFLIAGRQPPWVDGGNRAGWRDPCNHFAGRLHIQVGLDSEAGYAGPVTWSLDAGSPDTVLNVHVAAGRPQQILELSVEVPEPGPHRLRVATGGVEAAWTLNVFPRPDWAGEADWRLFDPLGRFAGVDLPGGPDWVATVWDDAVATAVEDGARAVVCLADGPVEPAPFWRECAFEYGTDLDFADAWEWLWSVSPDRVLSADGPFAEGEWLMTRIDTRTYFERPYVVRIRRGAGVAIVTTLRPEGGLGAQPSGFSRNAGGVALLRSLMALARGS